MVDGRQSITYIVPLFTTSTVTTQRKSQIQDCIVDVFNLHLEPVPEDYSDGHETYYSPQELKNQIVGCHPFSQPETKRASTIQPIGVWFTPVHWARMIHSCRAKTARSPWVAVEIIVRNCFVQGTRQKYDENVYFTPIKVLR